MFEMVDVGGFRLRTKVEGLPDAPWIMLSNSLAADLTIWDRQASWLGKCHRLLRYDTRGHGGSEAPPAPYALSDLVADVVALLDHYGIDSTAFMGVSLGGMTGLGLAIDHPGRVSRLVCCDARADATPSFLEGWKQRLAYVQANGVGAIGTETAERWMSAAFRRARPDMVIYAENMIAEMSLTGYTGCVAALTGLDYLNKLHRIRIPVLFVTGSDDPAAPPETMRDMASRVTDARFAIIPEACHLPNIDSPERFHETVAPFLGA